ncbi:unnamed protein product [Gongylonema pulchrum]|uniref:Neur_chan_LBD domain-containing protein n=1 Tax=Gongylonema pulchrum TaxID=637853 RepID=A0A183EZV7_9BILA|nr:unnamed protein product [Gongylonema pulchrum]
MVLPGVLFIFPDRSDQMDQKDHLVIWDRKDRRVLMVWLILVHRASLVTVAGTDWKEDRGRVVFQAREVWMVSVEVAIIAQVTASVYLRF